MSNRFLKSVVLSLLTIAIVKSTLIISVVAQDGSLNRVRNRVRDHSVHEEEKPNDNSQPDDSNNKSQGRLHRVRDKVRQQGSEHVHSNRGEGNQEAPHGRAPHGGARRRSHHRRIHNTSNSGFSHGYLHPTIYQPVVPHYHETLVVCHNALEDYQPEVYLRQPLPEAPPVYNSPVEQFRVVESIQNGTSVDDFANWAARCSMSIGSDFDDLSQANLSLLFQEPGGLGMDLSITTLRERGFSPSLISFRDNLWIGDVNLVFEPFCNNDIRMRCGIGLNWLADSFGSEAGLNLTAGFDVKLTKCLVFSAEGDIGTLGDADFWHGRLNLARNFGNVEWLVGIDHYNIGGASLHNVFTGVGFRF